MCVDGKSHKFHVLEGVTKPLNFSFVFSATLSRSFLPSCRFWNERLFLMEYIPIELWPQISEIKDSVPESLAVLILLFSEYKYAGLGGTFSESAELS